MKNYATVILFSAIALSCAKEETKPDFKSWQRSGGMEKVVDGKSIHFSTVLECRKINPYAENLHYYYSVYADPTQTNTSIKENNVKETSYSDAMFSIDYVVSNTKGNSTLNKGIILVKVDFKVVDLNNGKGERATLITANKETIDWARSYHSNDPYFRFLREGDEIMKIIETTSDKGTLSRVNTTQIDLPGISSNESIECL